MSEGSDAGLSLVASVRQQMRIDRVWSVEEPRGFSWWGHRLRQRVWAEPACEIAGETMYRVHAEVDLLTEVDSGPDAVAKVAALNAMSSLYAMILSNGDLALASHVLVNAGNLAAWLPVFTMAVGVQGAAAAYDVDALAKMIGGRPATSAHPTLGPRQRPDDMVSAGFFSELVRRGDSPWTGSSEWDSIAQALTAAGMPCQVSNSSLRAQIISDSCPVELLANAGVEHPRLGSGVALRLRVPNPLASGEAAALSNALNEYEREGRAPLPLLGSWAMVSREKSGSMLEFDAFLPAVLSRPNVLTNVALTLGARARLLGARAGAGRLAEAGGQNPAGGERRMPRWSGWRRGAVGAGGIVTIGIVAAILAQRPIEPVGQGVPTSPVGAGSAPHSANSAVADRPLAAPRMWFVVKGPSGARLRSEPSASAAVVSSLRPGSLLEVVGEPSNGWLHVRTADESAVREGWILRSLLASNSDQR